jgi:hypothetical protein
MPYSYNRVILAGIEPTPGVGATLTGAANGIRIMDDLQLDPLQLGLEERTQLFPWIGNQRRLVKQRLAAISFSFELAGSGTRGTAPAIGQFFRAAGYGETVVAATSAATTAASATNSLAFEGSWSGISKTKQFPLESFLAWGSTALPPIPPTQRLRTRQPNGTRW